MGAVKNLQVTDPTTSTLKVQWEPAEGDVRQYKVNYIPTAGGPEETVNGKNIPVALECTERKLRSYWKEETVHPDVCICYTTIQIQVPGRTQSTVLKNLESDTEYTVTVVPVYSAGEGQPMSENGETCKPCTPIICVDGKRQWGFHHGMSGRDMENTIRV